MPPAPAPRRAMRLAARVALLLHACFFLAAGRQSSTSAASIKSCSTSKEDIFCAMFSGAACARVMGAFICF